MTVTMTESAAAALAIGLTVTIIALVATLPRWLLRPLIQYRVWTLRDDFMDRVISGDLPRSDPAVAYAMGLFHIASSHLAHLTMADYLSFIIVTRSPEARKVMYKFRHAETVSKDPDVSKALKSYIDRMYALVFTNTVVGSWLGIVVIVTLPIWGSILTFVRRRQIRPSRYRKRLQRSTSSYVAVRQQDDMRDRHLVLNP